ncbi:MULTISPECIES: hypothetical protein [Streptomyces]|uniref:Uncharacterized protein n=1 Tax=Streptomyces venezuelae (strain ATCC 10712 / CBS 650.69 / DSM 40230 / JCM 4526 / NBRC 13096 / PD 04745) TaxID=953739 RepID=F2RCK4_STRVP|nr:hypothetical protein [Streptomyces venezuelae]APE20464.1 hypothetical protein vnz_05215 [Streptomyces venezuelae]CCA54362.1 hypothetical protein SVEN_1075 [Streptomyces venezuelae ATCC 10712]
MSSGHKTMSAFLTVIGSLIVVILGLCVGWPSWVWPLALCVLAAVAGLPLLSARRRRPLIPPEYTLEPDLPIPPVERWEKIVREVALPSRAADYDFLFTAVVRWVPSDAPHGAPEVSYAGLALDAVLQRAAEITAAQLPHRAGLVQHQLSGELATMLPDPTGRVRAMADHVEVVLSEEDQERLDKLATVRKNETVWEHERKYEQSKRSYLGKDVLSSTGSAVVWWLAKNNDQVDRAVADIGLLAQLTAVANDEPVPERLHPYLGDTARLDDGRSLRETPRQPEEPEGPVDPAETLAHHLTGLMRSAGVAEDDPRKLLFARRVAEAAKATGIEGTDVLTRIVDAWEFPHTDPSDQADPTDPSSLFEPFEPGNAADEAPGEGHAP